MLVGRVFSREGLIGQSFWPSWEARGRLHEQWRTYLVPNILRCAFSSSPFKATRSHLSLLSRVRVGEAVASALHWERPVCLQPGAWTGLSRGRRRTGGLQETGHRQGKDTEGEQRRELMLPRTNSARLEVEARRRAEDECSGLLRI